MSLDCFLIGLLLFLLFMACVLNRYSAGMNHPIVWQEPDERLSQKKKKHDA